jgi:hypothetical protein
MAMSLTETFGMLPDGTSIEMTWQDVTRRIRDVLFSPAEKQRKKNAARRQRLYMSSGDMDMSEFITTAVKDKTVQKKRLDFVRYAKFDNVTRHIVHEVSTVYALPAKRTVKGDDNNARYQEVQRISRQHEVMLRGNRLANLHKTVAFGPRVSDFTGRKRPVLDVVTPDCFTPIAHPLDPTELVCLVLDLAMSPEGKGPKPMYVVWSEAEWFYLDASGFMLGEPVSHSYGRIPWILFSIEPPAGCLVDSSAGEDLEAAHLSVWFLGVLLLKEAKSATKQHIISGELSRLKRDQPADSDLPIEAGEGTSITTVDNSMDLSMFRASADYVTERAAANRGIPPAVLRHEGATSAEARELQRVPLREIRLQQQIPFRDLERDLAELQSLVISAKMPELAFDAVGWSVDFADPQTPLGQKEQLEVFEQERRLSMNSTIAEIMRRNPDLDYDAARAVMEQFAKDELDRNIILRPLQAIAGTPGATTPQVASERPDDGQDEEAA